MWLGPLLKRSVVVECLSQTGKRNRPNEFRNAQLRALLATAGRARVRGSSAEADRATAPSVPHSGREGVIEFQLEAAAAESGTDHENLTGRRVPGSETFGQSLPVRNSPRCPD